MTHGKTPIGKGTKSRDETPPLPDTPMDATGQTTAQNPQKGQKSSHPRKTNKP
jgi:hypothetical protein